MDTVVVGQTLLDIVRSKCYSFYLCCVLDCSNLLECVGNLCLFVCDFRVKRFCHLCRQMETSD